MKRRLIIGTAVAALAVTATLLGGAFRSGDAASVRSAPPLAGERLETGFAAGDTQTLVERLQAVVRANPRDGKSAALLGLAYQERARETGDPTYYGKSEAALRDALRIDRRDLTATGGLGSLALSRHRFAEALALGRRAVALSPSTARSYGIVGDALLELGRYDQAFEAFDTMARLKPSLAAYARVSYARELLGEQAGAVEAMRLALDAASGAEPEAWTRVQLGKLYWDRGRLAAATAEYRAALRLFPGYAYALDALAQVEGARGHYRRAIGLEQRAVNVAPLPQYVAYLGDLYAASGRPAAAKRQYGRIGAIERLLVANGVRADLESALFDVDHGIRPRHALRLARLGRAERPSIDGDDVLSWALWRNGRCAEALTYSRRALRLGTKDALKYFHRGMVERCLGHDGAAKTWFVRALALNPHFSLRWAPVARRYAS